MKHSSFQFILFTATITVCLFVLINVYAGTTVANPRNENHMRVSFNIVFPPGTKFHQKEGKIEFELPNGVCFVISEKGKDDTHNLVFGIRGEARCDCKSTSAECSISQLDNIIRCSANIGKPCVECEMIINVNNHSYPLNAFEFSIALGEIDTVMRSANKPLNEKENMVALLFLSAVHPIYFYNEMINMPWVTEDIIKKTSVKNLIKEMLNDTYPNGMDIMIKQDVIPVGYKLSPISVEGHLAMVLVPEKAVSYFPNGFPALPIPFDKKVSCRGCGASCVLKSGGDPEYKVYYCEGCNSSCLLDWLQD